MASPYRIVEVPATSEHIEIVKSIDSKLIDGDGLHWHKHRWWFAYSGAEVVAYAGMRPLVTWPSCVFLSRCGVVSGHQGHGLQRRFVRCRLAAARHDGFRTAITYTDPSNVTSANNLVGCGFKLYRPESKWGVPNALYFRKELAWTNF